MICCFQIQGCQGLFVGWWLVFDSQHTEKLISAKMFVQIFAEGINQAMMMQTQTEAPAVNAVKAP